MFRASYPGECAFCGEPIDPGDFMGLASGENVNGVHVERAPACEECLDDLDDESEN